MARMGATRGAGGDIEIGAVKDIGMLGVDAKAAVVGFGQWIRAAGAFDQPTFLWQNWIGFFDQGTDQGRD